MVEFLRFFSNGLIYVLISGLGALMLLVLAAVLAACMAFIMVYLSWLFWLSVGISVTVFVGWAFDPIGPKKWFYFFKNKS